ncbi:HLA class II histocompatibility antigen gamma chain [Gastrophryne carolinensis]
MAEETQNLVHSQTSTENVVEISDQQPRGLTCNRSSAMPLLSVFVALLIAGQAVSIYFITQQQSKITVLSDATTALKLKEMERGLPGSPPSPNRPKLRMASFAIPLALSDTDGSMQKLEKSAGEGKLEDAVKYMLLTTNPLRTYPSFNGTILENLRKLRRSLESQEWMAFDAWLQQWYLFYLVQTSDNAKSTPQPTGAPVMTDCKARASKLMPGAFVPQCDEQGNYIPKQCWRSTGYCWCVYNNGTEIPETRSRAKIDCNDIEDTAMLDYEPYVELKERQ